VTPTTRHLAREPAAGIAVAVARHRCATAPSQ